MDCLGSQTADSRGLTSATVFVALQMQTAGMTTLMMNPGRKTMGFDAYLHDDDGNFVDPQSESDWWDWVSAGRTRNFCNGQQIIDWLEMHGESKGFVKDSASEDADDSLDFGSYVMRQGPRFEDAVVAYIERTGERVYRVRTGDYHAIRSLDVARDTFDAMVRGEPLIAQGVLRNPADRTFGGADLLVRSDVLRRLFPEAISEVEAQVGAPGIGAPRWHYRVIDIKFSTLHLGKNGEAGAAHRAYMVQVYIYNQALGRIQGYLPRAAYLLGRGWENGGRGTNCMERLAVVHMDRTIGTMPLSSTAAQAAAWIRRVRSEGGKWDVLPEPTIPELYPCAENMHSWHGAMKQITESLQDVTMMWQAGPSARTRAHAAGVTSWRDERCSAEMLGLKGVYAGTYEAIRAMNLAVTGDVVQPDRIRSEADTWATPGPLEFYVDFEWSNGLNDDFARVPQQNGSSIIFMIGCGHVEAGKWNFSCFVADDLSDDAEARIIDEWFAHMAATTARLAPGTSPLVFHWSPAEDNAFENQWNSAMERHPEKDWQRPNWFDFLTRVMRPEPVVVRGALGFGLKAIARAMKSHGLIDTIWEESMVDGLGAMVGAWRCAEQAAIDGGALRDVPLMADIERYNEVDCKVMMEIVRYLRTRT